MIIGSNLTLRSATFFWLRTALLVTSYKSTKAYYFKIASPLYVTDLRIFLANPTTFSGSGA